MEEVNDDASPMEIDGFDQTSLNGTQTSIDVGRYPVDRDSNDDQIYNKIRFTNQQAVGLNISFSQPNTTEEQTVGNNPRDASSKSATSFSGAVYRSYKKYPPHIIRYPEERWYRADRRARYLLRKQPRTEAQRLFVSESEIELDLLKNQFPDSPKGSTYFFHATSWKSAKKKLRKGPRMSKGPLDLAYAGAFYLNSSYEDCYDWLITNDRSFKGKHAMLIYKFDPEKLSKKGQRLSNKREWKELVVKRSQPSKPYKEDWIYTYQNSNPATVRGSTDNVRARWTSNGELAMQLIVYQERMCKKIQRCLIGCVFFEH